MKAITNEGNSRLGQFMMRTVTIQASCRCGELQVSAVRDEGNFIQG